MPDFVQSTFKLIAGFNDIPLCAVCEHRGVCGWRAYGTFCQVQINFLTTMFEVVKRLH